MVAVGLGIRAFASGVTSEIQQDALLRFPPSVVDS